MDLLFRDDQTMMREALRLAAKAAASDEVPIGAVIAKNGRIIGRGYNQIEMLKDPTAHAEILAITQAAAAVGDWRLNDCDLFVTKEPCPMCAGAAVRAPSPSSITSCSRGRRPWFALSVASRLPAAIARGKAAFQVHKIVSGDQNSGVPARDWL